MKNLTVYTLIFVVVALTHHSFHLLEHVAVYLIGFVAVVLYNLVTKGN